MDQQNNNNDNLIWSKQNNWDKKRKLSWCNLKLVDKENDCLKWMFLTIVWVQIKVSMYVRLKRVGIYVHRERKHICIYSARKEFAELSAAALVNGSWVDDWRQFF